MVLRKTIIRPLLRESRRREFSATRSAKRLRSSSSSSSSWAELIAAYAARDRGYVARRAPRNEKERGDYDQLARFGEWDITDPPLPERVGP